MPDLRLRRSEKMPSSNFFEFLTGRPKAWNLKDRHLTMSVPEMWKRLFLQSAAGLDGAGCRCRCRWRQTYQRTHETYSPVGSKKRRMYWSGCQSTGAEMRKYLTVVQVACQLWMRAGGGGERAWWVHIRLSTCCRATTESGGRLCWAS